MARKSTTIEETMTANLQTTMWFRKVVAGCAPTEKHPNEGPIYAFSEMCSICVTALDRFGNESPPN